VKLHRDGVISGPDDPQAVFCATLVRDFGASYTVKRSPSADREAPSLGSCADLYLNGLPPCVAHNQRHIVTHGE
jgi:hypothetical protein